MTGTSILGTPVKRLEDPRILSGDARYVADLELPGVLTAVFVRSTVAHAHLGGVDTEAAAKMPGVVAVYTADDLGLPDMPAFA
ncbi:MAG: aerobic carbon-monoxide dehydrogenase large subunit, partial [Actinomycetota bacterium]|nr:aerobic carbon-monoxide dehydrogenase large subunit [Actinomycetota bacterium]